MAIKAYDGGAIRVTLHVEHCGYESKETADQRGANVDDDDASIKYYCKYCSSCPS
jgi:hypothetical protein